MQIKRKGIYFFDTKLKEIKFQRLNSKSQDYTDFYFVNAQTIITHILSILCQHIMLISARRNFFKYFLLLLVFVRPHCYGQKDGTDTLFDKFKKDILTEQEEHNGEVVFDDETRETYYLLISTHPIDVLIKYTDDPIPAVRAEIFSGLTLKNTTDKILQEILNKHLDDTGKFTCHYGDVLMGWSVKNYMQTYINTESDNKLPEVDFNARLEKIRSERYIVIPGAHHGIITKDSLIKVDSLHCSLEGVKIISFTLSLSIRKKTFTSGPVFTERIKRNLRRLKPGESVYIEEIKAEGRDKIIRKLACALSLKVK